MKGWRADPALILKHKKASDTLAFFICPLLVIDEV